jgi:ribosomal protein S18 acetylase RimI-like enzyme
MENGKMISAAAEHNGKIVANSEIRRGTMKDVTNHGTLGIAIGKGYRNVGLGLELVRTLLDESRKSDIKTVELEVFANNPRAKHVYEKAGFTEVGRIPKKFIEAAGSLTR